MRMEASSNVKQAEMEAVIIRADGTREYLGVIAYYHRNPLRRWAHRLMRMFSR